MSDHPCAPAPRSDHDAIVALEANARTHFRVNAEEHTRIVKMIDRQCRRLNQLIMAILGAAVGIGYLLVELVLLPR